MKKGNVRTLVEPHVRSSCRFVVPLLRVCCFLLAFDLLAPGTSMSAMLGLHIYWIILQGPGPGLGACLFLCPPGVRRGKALAAQVWQGKAVFFIILGPKSVRLRACLFLCPAGIRTGRHPGLDQVLARWFNRCVGPTWLTWTYRGPASQKPTKSNIRATMAQQTCKMTWHGAQQASEKWTTWTKLSSCLVQTCVFSLFLE